MALPHDHYVSAARVLQGDPKKNIMPSIKFNTNGLTTNTGTPVANNMYSMRAGNRGPILLEDYHLLEKLGQARCCPSLLQVHGLQSVLYHATFKVITIQYCHGLTSLSVRPVVPPGEDSREGGSCARSRRQGLLRGEHRYCWRTHGCMRADWA